MKKNRRFLKYYVFALSLTLALCAYPLFMGIKAAYRSAKLGAVPVEEYPKYVIPYAPIGISVLIFVLLMPFFLRLVRKRSSLYVSILSLAVFWFAERMFETKVLVSTTETVPLESWQMSLCYVSPEQFRTRTWEAVDVLLGGYSPAFKIHFYIISAVLILSLLNALYGFGRIALTGETGRKKALILQSVSSGLFLGLCILACFTAFFRTGEMTVSALSAVLMSVFFVVFGVTAGIFAGSFLIGKGPRISVLLPSAVAAITALLMYVGEMCLLSGNLYRFGEGVLFEGIPGIVVAPIDILVILLAGAITALIFRMINKPSNQKDEWRKTL